jgi:hypothetical protein
MKIIMVKKILENGSECKKCKEVSERLKENNEERFINEFVYADLREENSSGIALAEKYGVDTAPFFIVEINGESTVYTSYMQLRKKVFDTDPDAKDIEIEEKRTEQEDPNEDLYWM